MTLRTSLTLAAALILGGATVSAQVTSTEIRITNGTNRVTLTSSPGGSNTTMRLNAPSGTGVLLGSTWTAGSSTLDVTVGPIPLNNNTFVTGNLGVTNGGTGADTLPPDQVLLGNSTGTAIVGAGAMTNGQLLIGNTGTRPTVATLTAGPGVAITNAAGAITIAADGATLTGQTASVTTAAGTVDYTITAPFDISATSRVLVTVHDPAGDGIFCTVTGVNAGTDVVSLHLSGPPSTAGRVDVFFQN